MITFAKVLFFAVVPLLLFFYFEQSVEAQKLKKNRPGVYITFKEFLEKTSDPSYPSQGARLEVHNNTRWAIYFTEHYHPTVAGAQISYLIEREDGCPELRRYVDVVMSRKLMPGRTISFVVPREDFPKGSTIYVRFDYSWELRRLEKVRYEAEHRAYFLSNNLPAWPLERSN